MSHRLAAATALAVAVLIATTACSSSGGAKPTDSPSASGDPSTSATGRSSAPPSSSSTPSPSPTSPSDVAKGQALQFVPTYYSTLDKLGSSRTLSLNGLDAVATDANVTQEKTALAEYRVNGWVQQGTTVVAATKVTGVNLTNVPSKSPRVLPTVHVTACIDVTKVREVDRTGKTVTLPSRPNFFVEQLTVVNISYPSSTGWRVSAAPNKGATSCAGV